MGFTMISDAILAGVLGALLGSFANMLVYRLPREKSIVFERSKCIHCQQVLPWYALVPVLSYLGLKGRCHMCKHVIGFRYLLIELLNIACFVFAVYSFGWTMAALKIAVLFYLLILTWFIDIETQLIPNEITYTMILFGIWFGIYNGEWKMAVVGALSGFALMFAFWLGGKLYYKKEALGGGDVKLAAGIGAFWGWKLCFLSMYLGFLYGGVIGLVLILLKKKKKGEAIAFGPMIVLGTLTTYFFGDLILMAVFG